MKIILTITTLILLSACSTHSVDRYAPSTDNVVALRKLDSKVNVGNFTATKPGLKEIPCRAVGPVSTPDGESFEAFIQKAFLDEFRLAEIYSNDANTVISGNLNKIDFDSLSGIWSIDLTVKSSNGRSITVTENYDYRTAYFAETACANTSNALVPAIQNLINSLINHNEFDSLIN